MEHAGLGEPVEQELHRQRRQQHAADAVDDVGARHAQHALQRAREQQQHEREHVHPEQHANDDPLPRQVVTRVGHHQHRRAHRARPGDQRHRQREHRDVLRTVGPVPRLVGLVRRCRGGPGIEAEHELDRQQQQQHAAGSAQCGQGDAHHVQQRLPEQGEQQQDERRDRDAAQRRAPALRRRQPRRQAGVHDRGLHRPDRGEERGERDEGEFEHAAPRAGRVGDAGRYRFHTRRRCRFMHARHRFVPQGARSSARAHAACWPAQARTIREPTRC